MPRTNLQRYLREYERAIQGDGTPHDYNRACWHLTHWVFRLWKAGRLSDRITMRDRKGTGK